MTIEVIPVENEDLTLLQMTSQPISRASIIQKLDHKINQFNGGLTGLNQGSSSSQENNR